MVAVTQEVATRAQSDITVADLRRLSTRRARALPWRELLIQSALAWGLTRLFLLALTICATLTVAPANGPFTVRGAVYARWWFWDGTFIDSIATTGYLHPAQAAYYPLFPALVNATSRIIRWGIFDDSLLIANLATFAACVGIGALAVSERRHTKAAAAVLWGLLASPFAFFLAAPYTDTIFLACAVWALLAMRRGWWKRAALFVALAGLARPFGVLLVAPLLWEFATHRAWWWRLRAVWYQRRIAWDTAAREGGAAFCLAVCALSGIAGYAIYCWRRWGDPLAFSHVEHTFDGRATMAPWQTVGLVVHQLTHGSLVSVIHARQLLDVVPVAVCVIVTAIVACHQPIAFTLYSVGVLLLVLMTPETQSYIPDALLAAGRCMLGVAPLWLALGGWVDRSRVARWALIGGGFALQAVLLLFEFAHGWLI